MVEKKERVIAFCGMGLLVTYGIYMFLFPVKTHISQKPYRGSINSVLSVDRDPYCGIFPLLDSTVIAGNRENCGRFYYFRLDKAVFATKFSWTPFDFNPTHHSYLHLDKEFFANTFCALDIDFTGKDIGWKYAYERGYTGNEEMIVAVIDGGLSQHHIGDIEVDEDGEEILISRWTHDLDSAIWVNKGDIYGNNIDDDGNGYIDDTYGYDFFYGSGDTTLLRAIDNSKHGAFMANYIAGAVGDTTTLNYRGDNDGRIRPNINAVGVCPDCKVMDLKIFGTGDDVYEARNKAEAIRYAVDNGAKIIMMALGYGSVTKPKFYSFDGSYDKAKIGQYLNLAYEEGINEALDYAWDNGVLVLGSAGNKEQKRCTEFITLNLAHYNTATNHPSVIQVGGIYPHLMSHHYDVSMPGTSVDIVMFSQLFNGTSWSSGTSQATALAAGMIAVYWSEHPELTHYEVKTKILEVARDTIYQTGADQVFWHYNSGEVNRYSNMDRSIFNHSKLWDDQPGRDDYYGYGFLNLEDLFENRKKREVAIDLETGAVDGYVQPMEARIEDFSSEFQSWYATLPKDKDGKVLGIDKLEDQLTIYPNPFVSFIKIDGLNEVAQYQIYSMNGRLQASGRTNNEIDLSHLESGIYIIKVILNQTEISWKRIRKE